MVVLGSSTIQSFAHPTDSYHKESYFLKSDFFFKVQTFIEDVRISFASNDDKVSLIKEFVTDKQKTINIAVTNNNPTSLEIEDRRMSLVDMLGDFTAEAGKYQSDMWDISEMNEIRLLYSQFKDCTSSCTPDEKQQFNNSVNNLSSWNNHCTESFNISNYSYSMESYDKLSNICPELKTIPFEQLQGMIAT
jgi:hypothetical protein